MRISFLVFLLPLIVGVSGVAHAQGGNIGEGGDWTNFFILAGLIVWALLGGLLFLFVIIVRAMVGSSARLGPWVAGCFLAAAPILGLSLGSMALFDRSPIISDGGAFFLPLTLLVGGFLTFAGRRLGRDQARALLKQQ